MYQKMRNYYYALCFHRGFTLVKEEEGEEKVVTRPPRRQRRRQDHYCVVMAMVVMISPHGYWDWNLLALTVAVVVQLTLSYLPIQMSMMITTIISSLVAAWSTKVSTQNGMHTIHAPPVRLHVTLLPPLRLRIREACGARGVSGSTLVEVTVEHPTDVHQEVVTVTGISSLHPGQSRLREDNDAPDSDMYDVEVLEEEEDGVESNGDGGRGIGNVSNATTNPFPTNTIAKGKSMQGGNCPSLTCPVVYVGGMLRAVPRNCPIP